MFTSHSFLCEKETVEIDIMPENYVFLCILSTSFVKKVTEYMSL
jgi:hypothetical protein